MKDLQSKTNWWRHEFKYLITESQAAGIEAYLRPYTKSDQHSDGRYPLVSLYLDSTDIRFCRESLEGHKNRFKLRIRSYNDHPDSPRFFEIKRRVNRVIVKSRARVPADMVTPYLTGQSWPRKDSCTDYQNLQQFLYYMKRVQAKPRMLIAYDRRALVGCDNDDTRITFDRKLSYKVTGSDRISHAETGWNRWTEHGIILEIKFTGPFPFWLTGLVKNFGLESRSISKYALSMVKAKRIPAVFPLTA